MIKSMTGFGKASGEFADKKFTAEVKSVNSKNFDCNIRVPSSYRDRELEIRKLLSNDLERGKIDFLFYYDDSSSDKSVSINRDLAKTYFKEINSLANELDVDDEAMLSIIMKMPDVMVSKRPELTNDEWKVVMDTIRMAVKNMNTFREEEGAALEKDFSERIGAIENLLTQIPQFEGQRVEKVKERINGNLEEFVGKGKVDENRLEQELIYFVEKLDITEEKIRLEQHCKYFKETLSLGQSAGKKLGFISQEIGREINTIGSKANDVDIQKIVVQMKDELEKIKEQMLNVL